MVEAGEGGGLVLAKTDFHKGVEKYFLEWSVGRWLKIFDKFCGENVRWGAAVTNLPFRPS